MSGHSTESITFRGIGASPGVAVGPVFVLDRRRIRTPKLRLSELDVGTELERFGKAIELSDHQLSELKNRIALGDAHDHTLILEAHRLMLHDPTFIDEVKNLIRMDHINAEWAVRRVARKIKHMFDNIPDEYFRERRADVDFVADRIVRNLLGQVVDVEVEVPPHAVVVAHDLSPADAAVMMRSKKLAGFVTDLGGATSHTAILARAGSIPAVVGAGQVSEQVSSGDLIAIDGGRGLILLKPTPKELAELEQAMRRREVSEQLALETKDLQSVSLDGHRVRINGNMEFLEEIPSLIAHGAEGIGLYRTEFLFLDRQTPPTEEEQYRYYREVLEAMKGMPVTLRTLDLGGDKVPGPRRHEREPNPALGLRAIRYCLHDRPLFRAQLRALLRASAHGQLRVMFPLISTLAELREAKGELELCRSELAQKGIPMGPRFPVGIMVETPSAVWLSDHLSREVDFFSIGTNDLIQYSVAIDRQNRDVAYLYQPLHLGVLRAMEHAIASAKAARIPVAICGEMAADPAYTLVLLALGFDEFSMTAGQISTVKQILRRSSRAEAVELYRRACQLVLAKEIDQFIRAEMTRRYGDFFA